MIIKLYNCSGNENIGTDRHRSRPFVGVCFTDQYEEVRPSHDLKRPRGSAAC